MKYAVATLALCAGAAVATPVQDARNGAPGTFWDIPSGVVLNNFDTVNSGSVASFFIRDTTDPFGAINIFLSQGDYDLLGLQVGDVVSITQGERDAFNGFAELTFPSAVSLIGSGGDASAIAITGADLQNGAATAEGLESQRVGVTAMAAASDVGNNWASGTNYTFTDGFGSFTVRVATQQIADFLNANYGPISAGPLEIEGIFGQFDSTGGTSGYQLLIQDVVPTPATATLLGLGGLIASRRRRA
ncbi:MAG: hypothetical protein ACF8Q5_11820 [Phycisphaerales bacterium JB040]